MYQEFLLFSLLKDMCRKVDACELLHLECYMIACNIVLGKGEIDGLHHQHLAGDGKADART